MKRILVLCSALAFLVSTAAFAQAESPQFIESAAEFLGHPIHPMLVIFPLGLFITSLIFDLIYIRRRDTFWHKGAYYLIMFGLIGGLLAAIPGFIDYFYALPSSGDVHEVAEVHWQLNLVLLALFAINLAIRWRKDTASGAALGLVTALSVVGIGIMLVSGWYGAHLIYEHRVGVEAEMHHHEGHESMEHDHHSH